MIIVKCEDEAAATAAIEKALRGQEAEILQSDTEDYTPEELLSVVLYNAAQTRKYVGRLERNTRSIDTNLKTITRLLEPLAAYATLRVVEEGDDEELAESLRRLRERKIRDESIIAPKIGIKAATNGA